MSDDQWSWSEPTKNKGDHSIIVMTTIMMHSLESKDIYYRSGALLKEPFPIWHPYIIRQTHRNSFSCIYGWSMIVLTSSASATAQSD